MNSILIGLTLCFAITLVASAPTEDTSSSTTSTTTAGGEMAETTAHHANLVDTHASLANSSFTCLNRQLGYYADVDANCKVYHFCMLGDYNGQEVYQRVSYMCLNNTTFDQQALDCVEPSKMTASCDQSDKFYDQSNVALRQAIIGQSNVDTDKKKTAEAEEKKGEDKKEEEKEKKDEEKKDKKDEEKEDEKKEDEKKDR